MRENVDTENIKQTAWNNRLASLTSLGLVVELSAGRAKDIVRSFRRLEYGIDFIRKAAPASARVLIECESSCYTDLFTQQPEAKPPVYAAQLRMIERLPAGKTGIRLDGQNVHALRGLDLIATFTVRLRNSRGASSVTR